MVEEERGSYCLGQIIQNYALEGFICGQAAETCNPQVH